MKPPWPWILAGLRRHAVPVLLMLSALLQMLGYLLFGDGLVAQIPPDGYIAQEERVRVSWSAGDHPAPFRVQLITEDGDFDDPLLDLEVRRSTTYLPLLEPGRTYRWRMLHRESGATSGVKRFSTAPHRIRF